MSTYATLDDLKEELGGMYAALTDRVNAEVADDAVGQSILNEAEAKMNSLLASRYTVPVDVSADAALAEMLKTYALNIAAHMAWLQSLIRKREPDNTKRLYDDAMAWLRGIGSGTGVLPGSPASPGQTSVVFGHQSILTEDGMKGF